MLKRFIRTEAQIHRIYLCGDWECKCRLTSGSDVDDSLVGGQGSIASGVWRLVQRVCFRKSQEARFQSTLKLMNRGFAIELGAESLRPVPA